MAQISSFFAPFRLRARLIAGFSLALGASSALAAAPSSGPPPSVAPDYSMSLIQSDGSVSRTPSGPIEGAAGKKNSLLDYQEDPSNRPSAMDDSFYEALRPLLADQRYRDIVERVNKAKAQTDPKTLRWYEAASRAGHIRLMWELSESLARAGRLEASTYWSYAALIGTYQETSLCTMNEIRFAADSLIRAHPSSREAAHQNGQIARDAMRFAFQLNAELPSISPDWLCRDYARDAKLNKAYHYDPPYWSDLRFQARERLARQLLNPPNGWVPGLAEAVAKGQFPPALWTRSQ